MPPVATDPAAGARVWFITGASSGFGLALALAALERGDKVIATARTPEQIAWLARRHGDLVATTRLDVTRQSEIDASIAFGIERFGRIDMLVNNAGYGYLAAVEEGEDREIRDLFETNVFGLAAVTRAALPALREGGSGVIINLSSAGGFVGLPGSGYYAASKFAIEGLSEALAREVEPLGLRVMIVEPGPFRTDWAGRSLHQSPVYLPAYEATAGQRRRQVSASSGHQPGDPERGARAIIHAAVSADPPLRLALGRLALETARVKLRSVREDLDAWESLSAATDYARQDSSSDPFTSIPL